MSKYFSCLFSLAVISFSLHGHIYAQPMKSTTPTNLSDIDLTKNLQERVEKLESELQELKTLLKAQMQKETAREVEINRLNELANEQQEKIIEVTKKYDEATKMTEAPPEFYWAKESQEFYEKGVSPQFGDTRTKPFLRRMGRNTYLGGYIDFEYRADEGKNNGFDQKRLIPFIYSDITDRVKFSTEIEFEHGGTNNNKDDGEIKVEFATVDFLIRDEVNLRGGIVLSPLGKFNLVHDSPLQDLTDRPMVDRFIIPTTLSESGAGFYGTFYPTELSKLDYEIYAVNGFEGLTEDGKSSFDTDKGLRDGRGSQKADFNGDPAVVGRLGFSPFLGLDFGGSFHTGTYDEKNDNRLTIVAFDTAYQRGPFELVGEYSNAFIERDSFAKDKVPDDMWGYYIEPRYHFMPESLKGIAPKIFTEDSTFTGITRWEQLDLDGDKRNRTTFGLNYRYTEDTVFKLDYQINTEHGSRSSAANNALLFSIATYF